MLAVYACCPEKSRGRCVKEPQSTFRDCFQRDRDRIIHSSAFRRLKYKTQVFVEHEGDYYCTRLTHSLEVAQVARSLACALKLNSDLTEAIALAHDLGHPPFGHAGEDVLQRKMKKMGGFDHNAQAFRIVTHLECHYADFDGLNLSWETLEGIVKHNGPLHAPFAFGMEKATHLCLDNYACVEAQTAAIADDIAYINRDIQDGLRAGLLQQNMLVELPLFDVMFKNVDARWSGLEPVRRQHEALRGVFGMMVGDVIKNSRMLLAQANPKNVDDVRALGKAVVGFSDKMANNIKALRCFLFNNMYRAPSVLSKRTEACKVIEGLFNIYVQQPEQMPKEWHAVFSKDTSKSMIARKVTDYLSGMTDRFAYQEAERLAIKFQKP